MWPSNRGGPSPPGGGGGGGVGGSGGGRGGLSSPESHLAASALAAYTLDASANAAAFANAGGQHRVGPGGRPSSGGPSAPMNGGHHPYSHGGGYHSGGGGGGPGGGGRHPSLGGRPGSAGAGGPGVPHSGGGGGGGVPHGHGRWGAHPDAAMQHHRTAELEMMQQRQMVAALQQQQEQEHRRRREMEEASFRRAQQEAMERQARECAAHEAQREAEEQQQRRRQAAEIEESAERERQSKSERERRRQRAAREHAEAEARARARAQWEAREFAARAAAERKEALRRQQSFEEQARAALGQYGMAMSIGGPMVTDIGMMHDDHIDDENAGPRIEILEERRHDSTPLLWKGKSAASGGSRRSKNAEGGSASPEPTDGLRMIGDRPAPSPIMRRSPEEETLEREAESDREHMTAVSDADRAFLEGSFPEPPNPPPPPPPPVPETTAVEAAEAAVDHGSTPSPVPDTVIAPPEPPVDATPAPFKGKAAKRKMSASSSKDAGVDSLRPASSPSTKKRSSSATATLSSGAKSHKAERKGMAMPHPSAKKIRPAAGPNGEGGGDSFSGSTAEEKVTPVRGRMPTLEDPVPDITEAEYRNLKALMDVFCRVPLLAEFSRPVSLLHPEIVPMYSKVVHHPLDLGRVCRTIRHRLYRNTRAIRLDMWRIFANCVKYQTHPQTRDGAVYSFVSIALHLREYFNALWQEFMLPSDRPPSDTSGGKNSKGGTSKCGPNVNPATEQHRRSFDVRILERSERLSSTSTTILSCKCLEKTADSIERFADSGGRVDELDVDPILETEEDDDYDTVIQALLRLKVRLVDLANSNTEYTVDELSRDVRNCYAGEGDILEDRPLLKAKFAARLGRLVGKVVVPIYETNCRGVNQSSVWGCMAAAIWARESAKRPYWPAIVLGILAPDDQREDWHKALTDRNEARLPEKLRQELQAGKRKAEQSLRRQSTGKAERMSFFLVEFLGTHEFIWVRESDIIENFDPDDDPNEAAAGNDKKKKRGKSHGQTPQIARLMQNAVEEGRWALEEFETQLNDTCGDMSEDEGDGTGEDNYTFELLCESDDEADEEGSDPENVDVGMLSDQEEITELLATEGLLDFSANGRKKAKQRAAALKKQKADAEKAAKKRDMTDKARKKVEEEKKAKQDEKKKLLESKKVERERVTEFRRELKELEKRRKKRERERERVMKDEVRKSKKMRTASPGKGGRRPGIQNKRERSTAIVRGYLSRVAARDNLKGLGLSGVLTVPAATIDTTGLLGMALAFRAAAGEIDMPLTGGPGGKEAHSSHKPWDNINADKPTTSAERCKALEKQINLLEGTITKLSQNDERRQALLQKALKNKERMERKLASAERKARKLDAGQKKKSSSGNSSKKKSKSKSKDKSTGSVSYAEKEKKEVLQSKEGTSFGGKVETLAAGKHGYIDDEKAKVEVDATGNSGDMDDKMDATGEMEMDEDNSDDERPFGQFSDADED